MYAYNFLQIINNIKLNGQLSGYYLKINQKSYNNLPNSAFRGWLSMESQPQNPEFMNNPEHFRPYRSNLLKWKVCQCKEFYEAYVAAGKVVFSE